VQEALDYAQQHPGRVAGIVWGIHYALDVFGVVRYSGQTWVSLSLAALAMALLFWSERKKAAAEDQA